MEILENIRRYCEDENISVKDFEKRCGLANGLVGKWKSGVAMPSFPTLQKIVDATGVELSEWVKEGITDDSCR